MNTMINEYSGDVIEDGLWGMLEGDLYPEIVVFHEAGAGGVVGPPGPVTAYEGGRIDDGIFVLECGGIHPTRGYRWYATEFAEVLRLCTNNNRAGGGSLKGGDLFGEFRGMPTVIHVKECDPAPVCHGHGGIQCGDFGVYGGGQKYGTHLWVGECGTYCLGGSLASNTIHGNDTFPTCI